MHSTQVIGFSDEDGASLRTTVDEIDTLAALECQDTTPARAKARLQRMAEQLHPRGSRQRRLAGATPRPWDRILTHPITGAVLHTDTYHRTRAIDRHVQARDQHCRFPGCRIPAIRCEIDHTHDYALGGRTEVTNLGCLCQRHHSMKQFTAWTVVQRPGGILEWTSPLGSVISDTPPPPPGSTVQFVRAEDDIRAPF